MMYIYIMVLVHSGTQEVDPSNAILPDLASLTPAPTTTYESAKNFLDFQSHVRYKLISDNDSAAGEAALCPAAITNASPTALPVRADW